MLNSITNWIINFLPNFFNWCFNTFIDCINATITTLIFFIKSVVMLFPANPCGSLIASCSDVATQLPAPDSALMNKGLATLAWILPMAFLVNLVGCAMMSIMIYFSVASLMRWLKLIT